MVSGPGLPGNAGEEQQQTVGYQLWSLREKVVLHETRGRGAREELHRFGVHIAYSLTTPTHPQRSPF